MRRWAEHQRLPRPATEKNTRLYPPQIAKTVVAPLQGGHSHPPVHRRQQRPRLAREPATTFEQTFGHRTTDIDATDAIFSFFFKQPQDVRAIHRGNVRGVLQLVLSVRNMSS